MKLSFVTPRFGKDIVGGAEFAVAQLAANCGKFGSIEAEILTTTAGDERTWSKKYEVGSEIVDGITIRRFANDPIDRNGFDSWASKFNGRMEQMSEDDFEQWLIRQGPYSPDLLDAIADCDSDAIVFHPMLSSPTSHGIFCAKVPAILHPALHDEPLARMSGYKKVVNASSMLCFSTFFEQSLSRELYGTDLIKQSVLGFGIDSAPVILSEVEGSNPLTTYNLEKNNYAIVLGRVDPGKGSDLIAKFFEEYNTENNNGLKLVFVGPISQNSILADNNFVSKNAESIIVTGAVSEDDKNTLISNAFALINPSVTESFSLVVLEAMKAKVPVIVNGACGPTVEHVLRSNSGYIFNSYSTFCACLDLASQDNKDRDKRIENGFNYVEKNYSWEHIILRYKVLLEAILLAHS